MRDFELEEIKLGEKSKEEYIAKYNISEKDLDEKLKELEKSDNEIFNAYPTSKIKEAIQEKINNSKDYKTANNSKDYKTANNSKKIIRFPSYRVITTAAAAVVLCALILPLQLSKNSSRNVRTKGAVNTSTINKNTKPTLFLYKLSNGEAIKLSNKESAQNGDVIQLSYNAGNASYGIIFSIDGNNTLTKHFPDGDKASLLEKNKDCYLPFSYQLDDAPKYENFYFITSNEEFSFSDLDISKETAKVKSIGKKSISINSFILLKTK